MSGFISKVKQNSLTKNGFFSSNTGQTKEKGNQGKQQEFSIQPHPAKSNDPKDLEPPQLGGGLNSNPEIGALHARDPYVPSKEIVNSLPPPASREEMEARTAELNK